MLNRRQMLAGVAGLGAAGALAAPRRLMAQSGNNISISRQLGILYIPTHVIETQGLVEKHAERLGLPGARVNWMSFANSSAQQDALLSGSVDIINSGAGPLLLLWDRTGGRVKGISACSAQPVTLITRDDRIQSLEDFAGNDKIAVPTVRISTQAILLQMAARQIWGDDAWNHFDTMTVQLGHADAFIALRNPGHEIRSHFAAPPFDFYALNQVPGARVLAKSSDIIGGPLTQGQYMTMTDYADRNPVVIEALRAAGEEARDFIENDIDGAIDIYKSVSGDTTDPGILRDMFAQPDMMQWETYPQGTMRFAEHIHAIGSLRSMPGEWTDYYLPFDQDIRGT